MKTSTVTLTAALSDAHCRGEAEVVEITHDSREVGEGWLFCCVVGARVDGHAHAGQALAQGAGALLVERWLDLDIAQIRVPSVRAAMGPAAAVVHGHPSRDLAVVGITGTNGKTTTAYLLESAFGAAGWGTATIGTVETRIHGMAQPGVRTTPEGTDLQRLLAAMRDRGVDGVGLEVSSHGLDLHRVDGTRMACAVFTNLTQDHLDWHHTMEAYYTAKAKLFQPDLAERAVVCVDDEWGRRIAADARVPVTTVGVRRPADHLVRDVELDLTGSRAQVDGPEEAVEVRTRLPGGFNLVNAVMAYLAAVAVGVPPEAARAGVAASPGVPGRFERIECSQPFTVLVDYAHTPDALTLVVEALRPALGPGARLLLVIGCGGDRDRGKRPLMGAAAMRADVAILTSDNPRSEDPDAILDAMLTGAHGARAAGAGAELVVEADRRVAIGVALERAKPGDVVVIAGKGHETGQEISGETVPFDDRVVARELLGEVRA